MKTWVLWLIRIVVVSVGLLMAIGPANGALEAATQLGVTTDAGARRALLLTVVGGWLMAAGFLGIYLSVAIGFSGTWNRLGQTTSPPGGRWGRRRANRQIDGKEPYRADDIAYLRGVAEQRVKDRRFSPMTLVTWLSLTAFTAGYALNPPGFPTTSSDDLEWFARFLQGLQFLAQVLRPLAVVMALLCVAALVASWRARNDEKGKAFLERTESIAWPTDGSR